MIEHGLWIGHWLTIWRIEHGLWIDDDGECPAFETVRDAIAIWFDDWSIWFDDLHHAFNIWRIEVLHNFNIWRIENGLWIDGDGECPAGSDNSSDADGSDNSK